MFLPFSPGLSKSSSKSMIENCSVISYWLGTFWLSVCLFVSNWFLIPIHDSMIIKITVLSAWLCWCFSFPFLQWYWIRIFVPINQPFILIIIIIIVISYDPTITYRTFTNDSDSNLPIIPKWRFELGFVQYW